jgi:hypothetical protein
MQTVFISYSHKDSEVADRLALDLRESEVPATYDKWLLRVGDSIIEKIATAVSDSDSVIALLSSASVESNWVKKELSLAMTGELKTRNVKVLPAVLDDCELPPMLADKLYADFTRSYYHGLRKLLEALCPSFYEHERYIRKEEYERAESELRNLLPANDLNAIREWSYANGYAFAALFGELWAVSEGIPRIPIGNDVADFMIVNGQSGRYEFSIIMLGDPTWRNVDTESLLREAERMEKLVEWCKRNEVAVRRTLAVRMASTYGAEQIAGPYGRAHLIVDAKLLCGRREEYGSRENELRNKMYETSNHAIDIMSYDRLLDVLKKIR